MTNSPVVHLIIVQRHLRAYCQHSFQLPVQLPVNDQHPEVVDKIQSHEFPFTRTGGTLFLGDN